MIQLPVFLVTIGDISTYNTIHRR